MKVSVIIKALNEEANISRSIESALCAISKISGGGEVILADSLSTDATIEIASQYPIKIAQLVNPDDRSCGVGAQLGYRVAAGEYLYILDADMEFHEGFLQQCVNHLDQNLGCAGVGGLVTEMENSNREFQERYKRKANTLVKSGPVSFLGMGGLYRRVSIEEVGYFTNRTLNAYEEFELGARLNEKGWKLERIGTPGVKHYGYQVGEYVLLMKRIKSGYIFGLGEMLRSAWGKPYFVYALKNLRQIKIYSFYFLWFLLGCVCFLIGLSEPTSMWAAFIVFALPVLGLSLKKKSFSGAVYTLVSGVLNGWGMVIGFFKAKIKDPKAIFEYKEFSTD